MSNTAELIAARNKIEGEIRRRKDIAHNKISTSLKKFSAFVTLAVYDTVVEVNISAHGDNFSKQMPIDILDRYTENHHKVLLEEIALRTQRREKIDLRVRRDRFENARATYEALREEFEGEGNVHD